MSVSTHRKVVTVLFCDVVGSTGLGESLDPEALQGLLARYFERMKGIVESHGGSVEKFIGDAVMAVFGVPVVHEDDALRACRAAVEMRDALPALGVEGRIGVNTGEVLTGTEERLATGDAGNVAARLGQAAEAGGVLLGGVEARAAAPAGPAGAVGVRSPLGESDQGTSADQIAWAFRKLLVEQAPLVVVLDDIQWGEETFLDLVEAAALLTGDAPILLLCMARPELLERHPAWPGTLRLEPLSNDEADQLIREEVTGELHERIAHAAGGNPLFISEMLAMAREQEDVEVPPTLNALLAVRVDQLDEPERRVLERGSIEGELFHRGGVQALAPEEPQVTARLT